jgi:hypothetical protein
MAYLDKLVEKALYVANANEGYGESSRNNHGPFIEAIGGVPGREWCAIFVSYCYRQAAHLLGTDVPFDVWRRDLRGRPKFLEPSAKALVKKVGDAGRLFTDPTQARPGDLVCWSRGVTGWQGHVGIVTHVFPAAPGCIESMEGNVGAFPARVKTIKHNVTRERLWRFASLYDR